MLLTTTPSNLANLHCSSATLNQSHTGRRRYIVVVLGNKHTHFYLNPAKFVEHKYMQTVQTKVCSMYPVVMRMFIKAKQMHGRRTSWGCTDINPECGICLLPLVPKAYKLMQTHNCQCRTILENVSVKNKFLPLAIYRYITEA